jgi:long-subunit acyl-CoA synthetase (AMP-forming)
VHEALAGTCASCVSGGAALPERIHQTFAGLACTWPKVTA